VAYFYIDTDFTSKKTINTKDFDEIKQIIQELFDEYRTKIFIEKIKGTDTVLNYKWCLIQLASYEKEPNPRLSLWVEIEHFYNEFDLSPHIHWAG